METLVTAPVEITSGTQRRAASRRRWSPGGSWHCFGADGRCATPRSWLPGAGRWWRWRRWRPSSWRLPAGGKPDPSWAAPARYIAAMSTFSPIMALLGAKRPQDRGWQFIVATLWAILSLPACEWLLFGGVAEIHPARFWFSGHPDFCRRDQPPRHALLAGEPALLRRTNCAAIAVLLRHAAGWPAARPRCWGCSPWSCPGR